MNHETGGAAFPCHTNPKPGFLADAPQGMTLRDYFAAKALQGVLAGSQITGNGGLDNWRYADIGAYAYLLADAMLEARKAQP